MSREEMEFTQTAFEKKEETQENSFEEGSESENKKYESIKKFLEENREPIKEATISILRKIGIDIKETETGEVGIDDMMLETLRKILDNKDSLEKEVEENGLIDGEVEGVLARARSLFGKIGETARGFNLKPEHKDKAKEAIEFVLPDCEKDAQYMDTVGKMLEDLAKEYEEERGKEYYAIKAAAILLQNEIFQKIASEQFRKWLEKRETEDEENSEK